MTDEEILRSIPMGGAVADGAVKALYVRHGQHMLRFFVHQGVDGGTARDVLQETMVRIVRGAASYSGSGDAKSWLWQVARNCLLDTLRKQARQHEDELPANDEEWQLIAEASEAPRGRSDLGVQDCVTRGLEAFAARAPERAFALTLLMEGLSMEEIGARIGRTAGATKEFLSQCRKRLEPYVSHCRELLEA